MFDNIFQGLGIFMCIGGVLLLLLVVWGVSKLAGGRKDNNRLDREDPQIFQERGDERPRYDSPDVKSGGGFGAPGGRTSGGRTSGGRTSSGTRSTGGIFGRSTTSRSRPRTDRSTGSGFNRQVNDRETTDRDDDDNIRSSGGFGGS